MNHEPNADQIVTRWVDEGPEIAPERFVWAALDQVERTPQRGSWRVALENTPMILKIAVPVLGAAAAIVLGIFALGRLNPAPTGTPAESPAAVASPTASSDPCRREVAELSAPGTLDIMWCVPRGTDRIIVPFTMEAPESWIDQVYTGGEALYFRPPSAPAIVFAVTGPDTIDAWVADITANAAFEVSEPQTLEIAGGEAVVIDVTLAEGANPDEAPPLVPTTDVPVTVREGYTARVWILQGTGEAVAVVTIPPDTDFAEWTEQADEAVQSLEWVATP
jgi:hypothetical protein